MSNSPGAMSELTMKDTSALKPLTKAALTEIMRRARISGSISIHHAEQINATVQALEAQIEVLSEAVRAYLKAGGYEYIEPKPGEPDTGWKLQQALALDPPTLLADLRAERDTARTELRNVTDAIRMAADRLEALKPSEHLILGVK